MKRRGGEYPPRLHLILCLPPASVGGDGPQFELGRIYDRLLDRAEIDGVKESLLVLLGEILREDQIEAYLLEAAGARVKVWALLAGRCCSF